MAQRIVNQIHSLLLKKQKTVAAAESCTGGLLSNLLTYIYGSSRYFTLGIVAYNNKVKQSVLSIPASLIAKNGAVSEAVARRMAESVRKLARADLGIAITGIAGPGGGTAKKPVGTVFIALESQKKKICRKFNFSGSRSAIRKKTALKALGLFKKLL